MNSSSGSIDRLMDVSFTSFVTSRMIKLRYGLAIVSSGLPGLVLIVTAFSMSALAGIVMLLVVAPVMFIISDI